MRETIDTAAIRTDLDTRNIVAHLHDGMVGYRATALALCDRVDELQRALRDRDLRLGFLIERHETRCGCEGEACDFGSDLAEFDALTTQPTDTDKE